MCLFWISGALIWSNLGYSTPSHGDILPGYLPVASYTIEVELHCIVKRVPVWPLVSRIWFWYLKVLSWANKRSGIVFSKPGIITGLSLNWLSARYGLFKWLIYSKLRFSIALLLLAGTLISLNPPTRSIWEHYLGYSLSRARLFISSLCRSYPSHSLNVSLEEL